MTGREREREEGGGGGGRQTDRQTDRRQTETDRYKTERVSVNRKRSAFNSPVMSNLCSMRPALLLFRRETKRELKTRQNVYGLPEDSMSSCAQTETDLKEGDKERCTVCLFV